MLRLVLTSVLALCTLPALGQTPKPPPPGTVIFSTEDRHPESRPNAAPDAQPGSPQPVQATPPQAAPDRFPKEVVTNAERTSVLITSYDLDLHLQPAEMREEVHANLTLRNVSASPLRRIPLQISGSLRWLAVATVTGASVRPLAFTQSPIATDADHTGYAQEAILAPTEPLPPGKSLTVSLFYAGPIPPSAARLELLGTPPAKAAQVEWDAITSTTDTSATALRGFGNVLWYPVAAPAAAFGDGNKLLQAIANERLRNTSALMRLRLSVEYVGEPPEAAILDGRVQPLVHAPDTRDQLIGDTRGIATAEFPSRPIGFRNPSLFLTAQRAIATEGQLLSIITPRAEAVPAYAAAATSVQPMLTEWLGADPRTPLVLLDHAGEPFEDRALLVTSMNAEAKPQVLAPTLVRGLTHAWFHPSGGASLWVNEGFAEFMSLLWTERTEGRAAALQVLQQNALLIALSEPNLVANPADPGEPLIRASSDVLLRLKSAAVFWQLREILGEETLRRAMIDFRHHLALNPNYDQAPDAFQKSLERSSQRDLSWFFDDWVTHDRGLPDLSIAQVNPRLLPARPGKSSGYLVAVEARNDGDAVAEVPVTVRSGSLQSTERLRIPAHASASTRILFEEIPETVQVNDGGVPEQGASIHMANVAVQH